MAEALRVLSVIPGGPEGSSMIFCRRLNSVLEQAGVDVRSFHLDTSRSVIGLLRELRRLRAVMSEFDPQILHAQYGTITALCCALVANRPLVVTFRGSDLNPAPSINGLVARTKNYMSQASALRADAVICVSDELRQRLITKRSNVHVVPSGVDTKEFFPKDRTECRTKLGWSDDLVVLFYGGRHPKVKRRDLADAAMSILQTRMPGARLHNMDGSVEPSTVPALMNAADCFLMTSDFEGSPTVIQEAKACDLPVVSVEVGDVVSQLEGVANCRIVDRDPQKLAEALEETLSRRDRSNGSQHLGASSLDSVARTTLAIYQMVAFGTPRGTSR